MQRCSVVRAVAAAAVGVSIVAATAAPAQEQPAPAAVEPLPLWERSLYKTLTYQTLGNLSDAVLYGLVLGGSAAAGPGFVAVNAATASAFYYGYEYAWESLGPPPEQKTHGTIAEKTALYRGLSSAKNFALGYAFFGSPAVAAGFVASSLVADTTIYLTNEYGWDLWRPRVGPSADTVEVRHRTARAF